MLWITREQVLAGRRSTAWYQLDALAHSRDAATRLRVAKNPSAQSDALWVLSRDEDPEVREQVARRADVPRKLLAKLSEDPSSAVRSAVARNATTSGEVLRAMAEDPHHGVRFAVQASQRQRRRAADERDEAVAAERATDEVPEHDGAVAPQSLAATA
ncbi:hypothetical protein FHN55_13745 [Streptomyces sp. NP160]|uniref:hypothetical protein n=1 Tax=Streptomyces sp. NP160 TaxID=2586637 RepID=UPI00111B2098|nr:hypothetical protein [Streptomyces sp. NP160]TNM64571.1 hypothetical protein FHN55_13745 [Streptomyces sp. NP160]